MAGELIYLEDSTMKGLHKKLSSWTVALLRDKKDPRSISLLNIQKEGDKFTCIASSYRQRIVIDGSVQLPVWVDGGKQLPVWVDGATNVLKVDINPNGKTPSIRRIN